MKYQIKCIGCGKAYPEDSYITKCKNNCNAVLRTEYKDKKLKVDEKYNGLWKYISWLPINNVSKKLLDNTSSFTNQIGGKFAEYLGLKNLIISFNTYKGMRTGTFKDIEAELSFQRLLNCRDFNKPFVLSSDGNIATSFTYYADIVKHPVVICVTEEARLSRIWSFRKSNPYVYLITMEDNRDYSDAIRLSKEIGATGHCIIEGGALNVARRDGVGTILLDATRLLGKMPDHYFQALGSGPGAIAIYETAMRLEQDGRYGKKLPRIHASQNAPFVPMYEAWQRKSREINEKYQSESAKKMIKKVYAHVLTNRFPAYSIKGGVFDALKDTNGEFYKVTNEEAKKAQAKFKKLEGYTLAPPAAVTAASLIKAVKNETVENDDYILINVTGGIKNKMDKNKYKIKPRVILGKNYDLDDIVRRICKWKKKFSIPKK